MRRTRALGLLLCLAVFAAAPALAQNLALNKPATGSTACNTNEGPAKAFNGSTSGGNTDKWCSQAATKWLQVDLGSSLTVGRFVVKHASAGGESTSFNTRDFNIQTSLDNASWSTAVTVAANTAGTTTHTITARSARYVRLNVTMAEQTSNVTARIYEMEVYAPSTTATPTPTPTPTPSNSNLALFKAATGSTPCASTESPDKAVNGSVSGGNGDKWCSTAATRWLQVDLGASFTVGSFIVKHAGAGGESTSFNTRDFNIQTSADAASWTTVAPVAGNTASTSTHSITLRTARYVRLNVTVGEQGGGGTARIYEFEVYSSGGGLPTPTPTPTPTPGARPAPPATLTDWIGGHGVTLTRHSYDDHLALYIDGVTNASWQLAESTKFFQYLKRTYDPQHQFGHDRLYFFAHQGRFLGGTISVYFDAFAGFRNAIDVGDNTWSESNNILDDEIAHEECHIVEGANNGIHESPAFTVWGDSKWAEFCTYDLYVNTGETAHAQRAFDRFMATSDGFPRAGTFWFRDWFYPLWRDNGGAQPMARFFQLLAQYFPKQLENSGRNYIYSRRMNMGEFVHFTSGGARANLKARATAAFGWTTTYESQWQQARIDFPGVTALYPAN